MKTVVSLLALFATLSLFAMVALSAENGGDDYIKVEIKGTLRTGLMAIGGETTGTVIQAGNVTWELDLRESRELLALVPKFDKKKVLVTGTYQKTTGVEIRERHIVKVQTLKDAG